MTVICPADATEAYAAVEATLNYDGPCYLRFGRFAVPNLTPELLPDYKFEIGKGVTYREGSDVSIIANGYMVHLALEAADILAREGISAEVINIHTVKPLDAELIEASARKTGAVVTAEEHSVIGGLGSAVCESLSEHYPVPVLRVGVEDKFGKSGQVPELLELYGLTASNIADKARRAVKLKLCR
jgi:transketolase